MDECAKEPTLWQKIQWPVIIIVLLGGHTFIMLVAMSFALAGPPMEIPAQYGKDVLGQPLTKELVLPSPADAE